eukprot:TRINITY_DN3728_c0_g3_i1.p1 TRINITY_DN3728_c0_g3~~TRINITY_DN3728_c0_g3_i1.p1  ORF type:complete len:193 (+),score=37.40 TRINITY_DN3728_c0_g3_i1:65-643(+)
MVEFEHDMSNWKNARVWSGGPAEEWDCWGPPGDTHHVPIHPRDMMDYHGLREMSQRDLFSRAVCLDGDNHLEVIRLQEELRFHFYYTGVDPQDGTDEPKNWLCLIVYHRSNWPGIVRGLLSIKVDLSAAEEQPLNKDSEDLAVQMMLRASDTWVTFCDPWLKKPFSPPEGLLESGKVYHYKDDAVKSLGLGL